MIHILIKEEIITNVKKIGTVDFLTVTFCTVSYAGGESISDTPIFNVYPNPSPGIYNLTNFENCSITILSTDGKVILNKQAQTSNVQIDLSSMPAGIYFMQVLNEGRLYYSKLIKQ